MYTEKYKEIAKQLIASADTMASAASSFTNHGYDLFISARDKFKEEVDEILTSVEHEYKEDWPRG